MIGLLGLLSVGCLKYSVCVGALVERILVVRSVEVLGSRWLMKGAWLLGSRKRGLLARGIYSGELFLVMGEFFLGIFMLSWCCWLWSV